MNDLMHDQAPGDRELEQALREALDQRALMARPSPDARAAVRARVAERRSGRRVRRGVGAAAAAAAALGGGLWLQAGSPVTVGVATGGDPTTTTPALTEPAEPDPRPVALPRFELEGEGFVAEETTDRESDPSLVGDVYRQVFRPTSDDPAAPTLTIVSIPADASYDIGEGAPAEVTQVVDVEGRPGYLIGADSFSPRLGWRLPDGSATRLEAIGIGGEALLEIAGRLERTPDGRAWTDPSSQLVEVTAGIVSYGGPHSERQYRRDGEVVAAVRVISADRLRFEELLLDRAGSATTMRPVEVAGRDGVVFGTGESFVIVWHDGAAIGEVVLMLDEAEALATLATLREVPAGADEG